MAVISLHFLLSPFSFSPLRSLPSSKISKARISSSSASDRMDLQKGGRRKLMEFPYVSAPHRDLMVDLVSTVETRLDSHLLPCTLPPDVQYFQNESNTAHGTLHIRSGHKSSPIDFILGSWLHCALPSGSALNITNLSAYLNTSTDAPNFHVDLIQSSPTSLVLLLDLPPRKDLVLHPDYLQTFYEDTQLERRRQLLEKIPEVQPYFSSALYIRCFISPTAIFVRIETKADGKGHMEEIVQNHVGPVAKELLGIWLDRCASGEREMGETERAALEKRDQLIKNKTIEIELGLSLPRMFGTEIAGRVLGALQPVFNINDFGPE